MGRCENKSPGPCEIGGDNNCGGGGGGGGGGGCPVPPGSYSNNCNYYVTAPDPRTFQLQQQQVQYQQYQLQCQQLMQAQNMYGTPYNYCGR